MWEFQSGTLAFPQSYLRHHYSARPTRCIKHPRHHFASLLMAPTSITRGMYRKAAQGAFKCFSVPSDRLTSIPIPLCQQITPILAAAVYSWALPPHRDENPKTPVQEATRFWPGTGAPLRHPLPMHTRLRPCQNGAKTHRPRQNQRNCCCCRRTLL